MPASSSARRFHSPESSPNHSNIHSCVPSGLVTKPSRDITILRTTFRSVMSVETYQRASNHRPSVDGGRWSCSKREIRILRLLEVTENEGPREDDRGQPRSSGGTLTRRSRQ